MNDRDQAIEILRRARDLLAERLTERVVQARDAIFEDALGMSPSSEIDSLYEQLGARLQHLNTMLACLPKQADFSAEEPAPPADVGAGVPVLRRDARALPAPRPVAGLLAVAPRATLADFLMQIESGMVSAAGSTLADLFDLELLRGVHCAQVFCNRYRQQPELVDKLLELYQNLANSRASRTLRLLYECFGLHGAELIGVMQRLHARAGVA